MGNLKATVNGKSIENIPVQQIVSAIQSVRYGDVQIVIQDSRVIQINKTEKVRFEQLAKGVT